MRNKALTVPFVLWAMIFIVVPLVMIVWYGVTVDEPVPCVEVLMDDGSVIYELEDGSHTTEKPWQKRAVVSLDNFKRMLEPTYLRLLLRSLKIAVITTAICLLAAALCTYLAGLFLPKLKAAAKKAVKKSTAINTEYLPIISKCPTPGEAIRWGSCGKYGA